MSKAYPLLLYESLESFNGAVITVQHQHGQGRQLGCPVPTITAVYHHRALPRGNPVCDLDGSRQNKLAKKNMRVNGQLEGTA